MEDLREIYQCTLSSCEGCSVLKQNKPIHAHMDYESAEEAEVLFLSDSLKWSGYSVEAFGEDDLNIIKRYAEPFLKGISWTCAASVKCPNVKEADMPASNMKVCRQYLDPTIDKIKPTLVIPCGNLAMKMLLKKSGINKQRGGSFKYTTKSGFETIVVPTYHPYMLSLEPGKIKLFQQDVQTAVQKYIKCEVEPLRLKYEILETVKDLQKYEFLYDTSSNIAVDVETTGLDFRRNDIMTIAISFTQSPEWGDEERQVIIPFIHFESPFDEAEREIIVEFMKRVGSNLNNRKIFHNAKFDMKCLGRYDIKFVNVWDTMLMSHLEDENQPKGLLDLVKRYHPEYLEAL